MKKLLFILTAIAAIIFTCDSCKKESSTDTPEKPKEEYSTTVNVTLNLPDDLTGTGFCFQANDILTWVYADDSIKPQQIKLVKKNISGASATFTMDVTGLDKADVDGYFTYNQASNDNANFSFVEGGTSLFLQSTPDAINRKYVHLHSGMDYVTFVRGEENASIDLEIPGSILNVKPYTTDYNGESVVLVEIKSETNFLGTVQYKRETGDYKFQGTAKSVKLWSDGSDATLNGAFPLTSATSETTALNYFFSIPASKKGSNIPEYTITVQTDQRYYEYVYTSPLTVEDNEFIDIPLLLDKAHRSADPKPWYTCDEIGSNWIPGASYMGELYVDEENKTEGTGSIALDNFNPKTNVCMFYSVVPEGHNTECTKDGMHLCFDFYCSDPSVIVKNPAADSQIELSSYDTDPRWDKDEVHWNLHTIDLKAGWNAIDLFIGDAIEEGNFNPENVTLFRMYLQETTGSMDVKVDNIHFYEKKKEKEKEVFPGITTSAYFHNCDNTDYFDINQHGSGLTVAATGQKEGTGCIMRTIAGDAEIFAIPRGAATVDAKITDKTKGHLIFWFYVENAEAFRSGCTGGNIEISHAGTPGKQQLSWDSKKFIADKVSNGWNVIDLPFISGTEATPDDPFNPAGANWFRIFFNGACVASSNTYGIDAIAFYNE